MTCAAPPGVALDGQRPGSAAARGQDNTPQLISPGSFPVPRVAGAPSPPCTPCAWRRQGRRAHDPQAHCHARGSPPSSSLMRVASSYCSQRCKIPFASRLRRPIRVPGPVRARPGAMATAARARRRAGLAARQPCMCPCDPPSSMSSCGATVPRSDCNEQTAAFPLPLFPTADSTSEMLCPVAAHPTCDGPAADACKCAHHPPAWFAVACCRSRASEGPVAVPAALLYSLARDQPVACRACAAGPGTTSIARMPRTREPALLCSWLTCQAPVPRTLSWRCSIRAVACSRRSG